MIRHTPAALAVSFLIVSSPAQAQADPPTPPYRAVLRVGVAHASPDPDSLGLLAQLDVETTHTGIGAGWDAAMGFQFGRQPLFVMTKAPGTAPAAGSHAGGYAMSETMRFGRVSRLVETAVVGRVGATRVDADAGHAIARNDIGDWAFVADASVDLRCYTGDAIAHLTARPVDPIVRTWLGIRHDQRFHRDGDLSGFDDPTGRVFGGVTVNPIRLPARGLTVGGGVEFERALRGAVPLPSGVRFAITAGVDLRKSGCRAHGPAC